MLFSIHFYLSQETELTPISLSLMKYVYKKIAILDSD